MSEWNAFRGWPLHGGWSGRAGMGLNPYAINHSTGDSSSGSAAAVAANLAAGAVGLETYGSIVMPSSLCGLVGLKPTSGLVSRSGTIPISFTTGRDFGPMGRTGRPTSPRMLTCTAWSVSIRSRPADRPRQRGDMPRLTIASLPGRRTACSGARIGGWLADGIAGVDDPRARPRRIEERARGACKRPGAPRSPIRVELPEWQRRDRGARGGDVLGVPRTASGRYLSESSRYTAIRTLGRRRRVQRGAPGGRARDPFTRHARGGARRGAAQRSGLRPVTTLVASFGPQDI